MWNIFISTQVQQERDDLYNKFVSAIHEVQQKAGFKNLLLEKKLLALADVLEKKEAQLNEVLSLLNIAFVYFIWLLPLHWKTNEHFAFNDIYVEDLV